MERLTQKTSTIIISADNRIQVFRSVEEVPPRLRRKLVESTGGANSATLLIADQKGREEILRSLRGLPSDVRSKLLNTLGLRTTRQNAERQRRPVWARYAVEVGLISGLAGVLWYLFVR